MPASSCRILSIAPYRVLPPTNGGHLGIVSMHDALGRVCQDHLIGTRDNGSADGYSFTLHLVFPAHPRRYLPMAGLRQAIGIARRYDATHIFCDHPYMAPLAIALSGQLRIPWVLRAHNIETARFRHLGKWWWRIFSMYERYAMRSAHGIFFITPEDCAAGIAEHVLDPARCHLAPYGTNLHAPPEGTEEAKKAVAAQLSLDPAVPWLYFIGAHNYAPNAQAVGHILQEVFPRLQARNIPFELIIGGKGLPDGLQQAIAATGGRVRYPGYIEDLDLFLKACDVMLNPLTTGGGIKTKAVEALGYNKIVVSTGNGAAGILPEKCGPNLLVTPDGDWDAFAACIIDAMAIRAAIPQSFYEHYNWDAIAHHIQQVMSGLSYR